MVTYVTEGHSHKGLALDIYEFEAIIRDPAKSDAEVREALDKFDFISFTPDKARDGLTSEEWDTKMSEFIQLMEKHLRIPLRECRPELFEQIHKEVVAAHQHCCGGKHDEKTKDEGGGCCGGNHSSSEDCCGGDGACKK